MVPPPPENFRTRTISQGSDATIQSMPGNVTANVHDAASSEVSEQVVSKSPAPVFWHPKVAKVGVLVCMDEGWCTMFFAGLFKYAD